MATLGALRAASTPEMKRAMAKRLREAAEVIAEAVRVAGARCGKNGSKRIPPSVKLIGGTSGIWVTAGGEAAPNAYPFEVGSRHPVFGRIKANGDRVWAKEPMPHIPFLEEGAAAAIDKAAEAFGLVFDDWQKTLDL